jgi:hypothetical protein
MALKLLIFEPLSIFVVVVYRVFMSVPFRENLITTIQEILFYPRGALWYIQAVIVATLLLMPIVKRKLERYAIVPALLLYTFATLDNRYHFLVEGTTVGAFYSWYESVFLYARNGLFFGFPLMLCGCLIARYENFLIATGKKQTLKLAIVTGLAYLLCVAEYILLRPYPGHDDNALYFSFLLLVPTLFALSIQIDSTHIKFNTTVLRNYSVSIYLLHAPISDAYSFIFKILLKQNFVWLPGIMSIITMVVICAIIYKKKWQPFYRWLI